MRLWPVDVVEEGGLKYYCLRDQEDADGVECRPLLSFKDAVIYRCQYPCPLVYFIRSGWRPACRSLPADMMALQESGEETMEVLPYLCSSGFHNQTRDDMALLCSLELDIADRVEGRSLNMLKLEATRKIMGCTMAEAATLMQSCLASGNLTGDEDLMQCLRSEAANCVPVARWLTCPQT